MSDKAELRSEYKRRRAAIPQEEYERLGVAVESRLLADEAVRSARTVYSYIAFAREVPTASVLHTMLERGVRVIVPPADRHADPLNAAQILRLGDAPDISEPAVSENLPEPFDVTTIDLFLVPGIVWDPRGYRIGFGGGFFDRLLAVAGPDALIIGLAFELQLVAHLPADPWDIPVDRIVTESRVIRIVHT